MRRLLLAVLTLSAALATAAPALAAPAVGVNIGPRPAGPAVEEFDSTRAAGAGWVRIFVNWSDVEQAGDDHYAHSWLHDFDTRVNGHRARGTKVLMVVSLSPAWASGRADRTAPPQDPREYAEFLAFMADRYRGRVAAWELWNEPDEGEFWLGGPDPAAYAALVRATYPAVKAADPAATVLVGGLVGNDFEFLEKLYDHGVAGHFDAVGVHLDTACRVDPPGAVYRDPAGRIGRFAFTGYREVRRTMAVRGEDKPIWITELGWASDTAPCDRPGLDRPTGVDEATQARFLNEAYRCLATDPYVAVALWFSLQDVSSSHVFSHRLGLLRDDASPKPAWSALREWAAAPSAAPCGEQVDAEAPAVTIHAPTAGRPFAGPLEVSASATDAGTGVKRIELWMDGAKVPMSAKGGRLRVRWDGAKRLPLGRHTLTVKAHDGASNVGEASVVVVKARPGDIRVGAATLEFEVRKLRGRSVRFSGRVTAGAHELIAPKGRVRIFVERRRGTRWSLYSKYTKGIARPFAFTAKVAKAGRWRAYAVFAAERPYRAVRAPARTFSAR